MAKHVLASIIMLLIAASGHPPAKAQASEVGPGDRIRLTLPGPTRMVGSLLQISPDSLVVATETHEMRISLNVVQRLEVSTGQKRNTGKGAVIGLVAGSLAWGLLGYAAGAQEPECEEGELCFDFVGPGAGFAVGAVVGGLLGAGAGALVGRSMYSERWERAPLETSLGLLRSHPEGWLPVPALRIRLILS